MSTESQLVEQSVIKAQQMLSKGQYSEALASLPATNGSADLLYIKAVCLRYLKKYEQAISALNELKKVSPEFGRAYQEEGHIYRAIGKAENAIIAYQRACQFNPALMASWKAMAEIFRSLKNEKLERHALAQFDRLKNLPKYLLAVTNFMHEGKIFKAEEICRAYLLKNPKDTEGMRLLAEIGSRLGVMEDAEFLLQKAIEFEPDNIQLRLDYIKVLRKRQKYVPALKEAEYLHNLDPENILFLSGLAIEQMQTGDYENALENIDKVLSKTPNDPATLTAKGHALKTFGKPTDAVDAYKSVFSAKPDHGEAYYSLANLKTYRFSDDELSNMEYHLENSDLGYMDRVYFNFALGKAFEDRSEFERSFEYYNTGNELKRVQMRYTSKVMTDEKIAQMEHCSSELFEKQRGKGNEAPDPIFILGLPRAGSTLLEQILASHSLIDGTLELPNILSLSHKLRGRSPGVQSLYPANLHDLTEAQLKMFGQQFIDETRIHRKNAPYFIDKMPNNFRHIGLIKLILPNAKIIDARRHPMACCFSGFKQLFAEGQEFTYGLEEIGKYYSDYVSLMDHWDKVLPGQILRVQYEEVVGDIENQVRRILDYMELPFEESCVEFHKNKRSVRTASSEQVRQPIYTSGLEQWRNFEPWLGPLKEALGPDILKRYPI